MYNGAIPYWDRTGKEKVREALIKANVDRAEIDVAMSVIEDVVDEVRWEAKQDGSYEESYYHVCNPD